MRLHLPDPAATDRLGRALAATRPPRAAVHLYGNLGAGKSSLARALLRGLGVEGTVRSPTYTLVERYPLADGEAWHLDLYRIGDPGELDYLGLDADDCVLWLVEWPERGGAALPPADLRVSLEASGDGRDVELEALTDTGTTWLERVSFT